MSFAYIADCNKGDHYKFSYSRENVVKFITKNHTIKPPCFGCIEVDENDIAGSMTRVAKQFGKDSCIRIRHLLIYFSNGPYSNFDFDFATACELGRLTIEGIGKKYQAIYGVHSDSSYIRLHVAFNTISYLDGSRFWVEFYKFDDLQKLYRYIKEIAHLHGVTLCNTIIAKSSIPEEF